MEGAHQIFPLHKSLPLGPRGSDEKPFRNQEQGRCSPHSTEQPKAIGRDRGLLSVSALGGRATMVKDTSKGRLWGPEAACWNQAWCLLSGKGIPFQSNGSIYCPRPYGEDQVGVGMSAETPVPLITFFFMPAWKREREASLGMWDPPYVVGSLICTVWSSILNVAFFPPSWSP